MFDFAHWTLVALQMRISIFHIIDGTRHVCRAERGLMWVCYVQGFWLYIAVAQHVQETDGTLGRHDEEPM